MQTGLSSAQVAKRIKQGKVNISPRKNTNTIGKIVTRNTLTIFNLVNLVLAIMVLLVGSYKNMLFILIAIANTLIAIINEIRAKKTVDKMRLLAEQKPTVIRDGEACQINQEQIVEGDLIIYGLGDQIIVDSKIEEGSIEVNESFITGEQDSITKNQGDKLISGSFVVSGTCKATVTAVGAANYINKLESSAHIIKTDKSELFTIMNNIVKYISFALIPIGALLLWARFRVPDTSPEVAVTSTVAALINMIPEGLILLTSSVLALATMRLARKKVLVQDLYSIETLARVDCIALDKTGTLTTGKMTVKDIVPEKGVKQKSLEDALKLILSTTETDNATSTALKAKLLKSAKYEPTEQIEQIIPFSSERKYSGVVTDKATYLMGAPEYLTDKTVDFDSHYRVIAVIKAQKWGFEESAGGYDRGGRSAPPVTTGRRDSVSEKAHFELLGFVLLEDELRKDAKDIIKYFDKNDVAVKIISGDNLKTVTNIATTVGVKNADQGIDLSTLEDLNYNKLVEKYTIFTRVKPSQKKQIIEALKKQGNTVAMTGDGVNDILAMKEADCSIAIGDGSDAARRSAKLVLLESDFAAVPSIIDEGRQTINNLERSTALFLAKTVYASILAIIFVFLPMDYPFSPIEMSLLNFACIGFPGLILALEKNTNRIKNNFTKNILQYSFPIGLTVSICMATLSVVANIHDFSRPELTTASVFITFIIDLILIYWISRPLNKLRTTLIFTIIGIMALAFVIPLTRDFFEFTFLNKNGLIIILIIIAAGFVLFEILRRLMRKITDCILVKK